MSTMIVAMSVLRDIAQARLCAMVEEPEPPLDPTTAITRPSGPVPAKHKVRTACG